MREHVDQQITSAFVKIRCKNKLYKLHSDFKLYHSLMTLIERICSKSVNIYIQP